tara:strand:+ start:19343 stop:20122 length:780 start_codon:yes stop_codon:yes gene_type:complete
MILQEEFKKYNSIIGRTEYTKETAKQLALWCSLVYKTDDRDFFEDTLSHYTKSDYKLFDNDGTEALCLKTGKTIILVFRGTEPNEMKDVMADINIIPRIPANEKQGIVHSGFALALDKIWPQVESYLDGIYQEGDCIYISGHSLGGALATVAAARSKYVCQVYTYGQPRVGSKKYADNVKSRIYRHVRGCDIVPSIPFGIVYKHTGLIIVVDKLTKTCYSVPSASKLARIRLGQYWKNILSISNLVGDHDIMGYYRDIN